LPPFDATDVMMGSILFFGALFDMLTIVGIVGLVITAYNDRKKAR
jgi:hypothetical protein